MLYLSCSDSLGKRLDNQVCPSNKCNIQFQDLARITKHSQGASRRCTEWHVTKIIYRKKHLADEVKTTSIAGRKKILFRVVNNFPDCLDGNLGQISFIERFFDCSSACFLWVCFNYVYCPTRTWPLALGRTKNTVLLFPPKCHGNRLQAKANMDIFTDSVKWRKSWNHELCIYHNRMDHKD